MANIMTTDKAAAADTANVKWVQTARGRGYQIAMRVKQAANGLFRVTAVATRDADTGFLCRPLASFHTKAQASAYSRQIEAA